MKGIAEASPGEDVSEMIAFAHHSLVETWTDFEPALLGTHEFARAPNCLSLLAHAGPHDLSIM